MSHQLPEQMTNVPNLQQFVSQASVTVGPLVLPASEILQISSEYLLYIKRGHGSFGAPLRGPGHKNYPFLSLFLQKPRVTSSAPASLEDA